VTEINNTRYTVTDAQTAEGNTHVAFLLHKQTHTHTSAQQTNKEAKKQKENTRKKKRAQTIRNTILKRGELYNICFKGKIYKE
jgi:NADPH-dependent ferric siderophore reductase